MKAIKIKISLLFLIFAGFSLRSMAQDASKIYVSVSGSDSNTGTLSQPFATIAKAMSAVQQLKRNGLKSNVQVIFRQGVYAAANTLEFTPDDGGDATHTVTYMSYPGEKAVISGGKHLTATWQKDNGAIWKYNIGAPKSEKTVFRSLYIDDKRLVRAHSPNLYTVGVLPQYAKSFKMNKNDRKNTTRLKTDSIEAYAGFTYKGTDLNSIVGNNSAEMVLYGSWEASWHKIASINTNNNTVLLKTPARYPVGFFNVRAKYRIENVKQYLNKPGTWCYDEDGGYLYYYAYANEDPNKKDFYAPVLSKLITITGTDSNPVLNLKFSGLRFRYTNSEWAVNAISKTQEDAGKAKFPYLDFTTGFVSAQGAFGSGQAVLTTGAKNCSFSNCDFSCLDNYAVRLGEYSTGNSILNCDIHDSGSGGVIIGFDDTDPVGKNKPQQMSPSYNNLKNCNIYNLGLLHPSGVGIAILQANHSVITNNMVYNLPYTGISCGWTFDNKDNFTSNNLLANNTVHDVMKDMADGGGIYTLGKQVGTVYRGNYIYNIGRSADAIGSKNNGFFFDQSSSGFQVDSNVVMSVLDKEIRFNKSDSAGIKMGRNYFEKSQRNMDVLKKVNRNKTLNLNNIIQ